jgi:hypothetical protein
MLTYADVCNFAVAAGMSVTDALSASPLKGGVPPFRNSKRERGLHEAFPDEGAGSLAGAHVTGTHVTCFTGTKAQILTPEELRTLVV